MPNSNALLLVLASAVTFTNAWDDSYIKIGPKAKRPENSKTIKVISIFLIDI